MKIRKTVSSFAVVILACCSVGCRDYFLSYPYPWITPKKPPQESEMVGRYKIVQLRLPSTVTGIDKAARIVLKSDHSAELFSVPQFDKFAQKIVCSLSAAATWKLDNVTNNGRWSVEFQVSGPTTKPMPRECDLATYSDFEGLLVLGRHAPYRLYIVGDPDSDTGIEFGRSDRD
jgi:hypothetical protein